MSITTQEIVDYVMDSPSNTNPAVLRSLLNQYDGNGSGEDNFMQIDITMTEPQGPGETRSVVCNTLLDDLRAIIQAYDSDDQDKQVGSQIVGVLHIIGLGFQWYGTLGFVGCNNETQITLVGYAGSDQLAYFHIHTVTYPYIDIESIDVRDGR